MQSFTVGDTRSKRVRYVAEVQRRYRQSQETVSARELSVATTVFPEIQKQLDRIAVRAKMMMATSFEEHMMQEEYRVSTLAVHSLCM